MQKYTLQLTSSKQSNTFSCWTFWREKIRFFDNQDVFFFHQLELLISCKTSPINITQENIQSFAKRLHQECAWWSCLAKRRIFSCIDTTNDYQISHNSASRLLSPFVSLFSFEVPSSASGVPREVLRSKSQPTARWVHQVGQFVPGFRFMAMLSPSERAMDFTTGKLSLKTAHFSEVILFWTTFEALHS